MGSKNWANVARPVSRTGKNVGLVEICIKKAGLKEELGSKSRNLTTKV